MTADVPTTRAISDEAVLAGVVARGEYRRNRAALHCAVIDVDEVHRILTAALPHLAQSSVEAVTGRVCEVCGAELDLEDGRWVDINGEEHEDEAALAQSSGRGDIDWRAVTDRVLAQRFTDDDGNDVGTMPGGHAHAAVTLVRAAVEGAPGYEQYRTQSSGRDRGADHARDDLAQAWGEGRNAGAADSAVIIGWGVKGAPDDERPESTPNPYRADEVTGR